MIRRTSSGRNNKAKQKKRRLRRSLMLLVLSAMTMVLLMAYIVTIQYGTALADQLQQQQQQQHQLRHLSIRTKKEYGQEQERQTREFASGQVASALAAMKEDSTNSAGSSDSGSRTGRTTSQGRKTSAAFASTFPDLNITQFLNPKHNNGTTSKSVDGSIGKVVIDIISVGSMNLNELQKAQRFTFGSHPSVRIFYNAQESDDMVVDPDCHTKLTMDHIRKVAQYCRRNQPNETDVKPFFLNKIRQRLVMEGNSSIIGKYPFMFDFNRHFATEEKLVGTKSNPVGWLCAQKRPIGALSRLIQAYNKNNKNDLPLPDYLFLIDDDTYVDIDKTLTYLLEHNPPSQKQVVAGCLYAMLDENHMSFPYGGFGTILSKATLEMSMKPIYCDADGADPVASIERQKRKFLSTHSTSVVPCVGRQPDQTNPQYVQLQEETHYMKVLAERHYELYVCERLIEENHINEYSAYKEGMNIIEIFAEYARQSSYLNIDQWKEPGFCFHSDTYLGYMYNTYALGQNEPQKLTNNQWKDPIQTVLKQNYIQTYDNSIMYYGCGTPNAKYTGRRCWTYGKSKCKPESDSHICHYITEPKWMRTMHKKREAYKARQKQQQQ